MSEVIVVTTPELPGHEIVKILGPVHGITVRTRGVGGKLSPVLREFLEVR
ncbi:MAG: heavy metal-binding domain-containing protein [Candidatus Bathyarchaeia archaeon]